MIRLGESHNPCILASPVNGGSWLVVIVSLTLETNQLQLFKKLFYGNFLEPQNVILDFPTFDFTILLISV